MLNSELLIPKYRNAFKASDPLKQETVCSRSGFAFRVYWMGIPKLFEPFQALSTGGKIVSRQLMPMAFVPRMHMVLPVAGEVVPLKDVVLPLADEVVPLTHVVLPLHM